MEFITKYARLLDEGYPEYQANIIASESGCDSDYDGYDADYYEWN